MAQSSGDRRGPSGQTAALQTLSSSHTAADVTHYSVELVRRLNDCRACAQFTDAVLVAGEQEFPCHRNVLAVSSEYFCAMFSTPLKESRDGRVTLQGVSAPTLRRILDYVYTGRVEVDRDSAEDTLAAAALYQYPAVVDACCAFIAASLDPLNCLGVEAFARLHGCTRLAADARRHAMESFAATSEGEEFRVMDVERLAGYLESDELELRAEELVFEAAARWVAADSMRRSAAEVRRVVECVRFAYIDPQYFEQRVMTFEPVVKHAECRDFMQRAFAQRRVITVGDPSETPSSSVVPPRPSTVAREAMVVIGGEGGPEGTTVLRSVEAYDPVKNRWTSLPPLPEALVNFSATALNNDIYVIGGEIDRRLIAAVWRFVSSERRWVSAPPLITPRSCHASAAWDARIYVIGGVRTSGNRDAPTDDAAARSIECLDTSATDPIWCVAVADIPFPRQLSQVIPYSTSLVELGGTVNRFPSKKMEIYQCNNSGFKYSGEQFVLTMEIQYAKVAFLDGCFLIVWEDTGRVIALSPTKRTYKQIASVSRSHMFGGATVVNQRLYVAGGLADAAPCRVVERYDGEKDVWVVGTPMSEARARHGCVTISISL